MSIASAVAGAAPVKRVAVNWPSLIESLLAIAAIVAIVPWFERLAGNDAGRDGRFNDAAISVGGLPERILPALCASRGAQAEPAVRDRLCRRAERGSEPTHAEGMPAALIDAFAQAGRAFRQPLIAAEQRRAELRLQQREGLGDLLALGDAIEDIDTEIQPYIERYALGNGGDGQPLPLACAFDQVKASLARQDAIAIERGASARQRSAAARRGARRPCRDAGARRRRAVARVVACRRSGVRPARACRRAGDRRRR